jgi:hypothetical protein
MSSVFPNLHSNNNFVSSVNRNKLKKAASESHLMEYVKTLKKGEEKEEETESNDENMKLINEKRKEKRGERTFVSSPSSSLINNINFDNMFETTSVPSNAVLVVYSPIIKLITKNKTENNDMSIIDDVSVFSADSSTPP